MKTKKILVRSVLVLVALAALCACAWCVWYIIQYYQGQSFGDRMRANAPDDTGSFQLERVKIPVDFPGDTAVKEKITVLDKEYEVTCVSMGNPHCVIFGKDPDMIDLEKIGPHFEHFEKFPERINTEFHRGAG